MSTRRQPQGLPFFVCLMMNKGEGDCLPRCQEKETVSSALVRGMGPLHRLGEQALQLALGLTGSMACS